MGLVLHAVCGICPGVMLGRSLNWEQSQAHRKPSACSDTSHTKVPLVEGLQVLPKQSDLIALEAESEGVGQRALQGGPQGAWGHLRGGCGPLCQ